MKRRNPISFCMTAGLCLMLAGGMAPAEDEAEAPAAPAEKAVVVQVERPEAVVGFNVDGAAVRDMFNAGLAALTGARSPGESMKALGIVPEDVVGIKISTEGGPVFSTKRALVGAIVKALQDAGVPAQNLIIWDKQEKVMRAAQWPPSQAGPGSPAVTSVVPGTWWDPKTFYVHEVVGKLIYGDFQFVGKVPTGDALLLMAREEITAASAGDGPSKVTAPDDQTSNKSFFAKLVTQTCTKLINVPVLCDDPKTGLHGCLASMAVNAVDNTRRFTGPNLFGDTAVPEIMEKDFMRKKVVLYVLDALIAQYAGGPKFDPAFCESPGALYLSRDAVAIDTLVLERMEAWRKKNNVNPLGKTARHVAVAAEYGVGEGNAKNIQVKRVK